MVSLLWPALKKVKEGKTEFRADLRQRASGVFVKCCGCQGKYYQ
jgi:hypothetical protein